LDWLFSLPAEFRYNFNPRADSRLGSQHSESTKAKISSAIKGANNPKSKTVLIYSLDNLLIKTYSSQTAAAQFLGISQEGVSKAIQRGSIVKGMYRVRGS